jgi:hypothetical protein
MRIIIKGIEIGCAVGIGYYTCRFTVAFLTGLTKWLVELSEKKMQEEAEKNGKVVSFNKEDK